MTENSENKVIVPFDVVADPTRPDGRMGLSKACEAVAAYVHNVLGLPDTDATTKVYYWDSEWWNAPASMVLAFDSDGKPNGWNGGFRTKLGHSLTGHTMLDVKAGKGTGSSTGTVEGGEKPASSSKRTATASTTALIVSLDMETGIIDLDFGQNSDGIRYSAEDENFIIPRAAVNTYLKRVALFAVDPRRAVLNASERTADGNIVTPGFAVNGAGGKSYTSRAATKELAGQEIAQAIIKAMDLANVGLIERLMRGDDELIVSTGQGLKEDFAATWLPEPVVVEPAKPGPSEVPMTKEEEAKAFAEGKLADAVTAPKPQNVVVSAAKVETKVEEPAPVTAQAQVAHEEPAQASKPKAKIIKRK